MWYKFSFVFLYFFMAIFVVNTNYHHVNEVFNSINHHYLYAAVKVNLNTNTPFFDKPLVREIVTNHFMFNIRVVKYDFYIDFMKDGEVCLEEEESIFFTIYLNSFLGFGAVYNKTFSFFLA